MTREEAGKILADYVKACREDDMLTLESFEYEKVITAMDMGAKALTPKPLMTDMDKEKKLRQVMKKVTSSKKNAVAFLKSAGIMTRKGNLSPKYR